MWQMSLFQWQRELLKRLEGALGRTIGEADIGCVAWNPEGETLTVVTQPLLGELRAQNLISNVFRAGYRGRQVIWAPRAPG